MENGIIYTNFHKENKSTFVWFVGRTSYPDYDPEAAPAEDEDEEEMEADEEEEVDPSALGDENYQLVLPSGERKYKIST